MKHVKEKITYEFDVESFEKDQAYKITLPTIGLQKWEVVAILDEIDSTRLVFITNQYAQRPEIRNIGGTSINSLTIDIDDYIKGDIAIAKLGVI
jgi:hypothetical protein